MNEISSSYNTDWINSEEHREWVKLAKNKPKQQDVGYWWWDSSERKFKWCV